MDAFIRRHQSFFVSLLVLFAGMGVFVYTSVLDPLEVARQDMNVLQKMLRDENAKLIATRPKAEEKSSAEESSLRSLPNFMRHINTIAAATKVIVRDLSPSREGGVKFNIKIIASYRVFLAFVSKLESLNVVINDLQFHPYQVLDQPGAAAGKETRESTHAIEFSITPRQDAEPIDNERLETMRTAVAQPNTRNPFQRFAYDPNFKVRQEVDLTWIYKLTGIGRVGDARTATILNMSGEPKDYHKGDRLDDMAVASVESDRVYLEKKAENGSTDRFVIKFRVVQVKK